MFGRVVERVSGQTLDAFFQHRIFDPLDMRDTVLRRGVVKIVRGFERLVYQQLH